jgi:hypothetical protein
MHYFRIHPDYWEDRLQRAKAMGLNAVEVGGQASALAASEVWRLPVFRDFRLADWLADRLTKLSICMYPLCLPDRYTSPGICMNPTQASTSGLVLQTLRAGCVSSRRALRCAPRLVLLFLPLYIVACCQEQYTAEPSAFTAAFQSQTR